MSTYLNQTTVLLREEAKIDATIATEAFYGEPITILEKKDGWLKVQTDFDGYPGWIQEKSLNVSQLKEPYPKDLFARVSTLKAHVYDIKDTEKGPILSLPGRSCVEVVEFDTKERWLSIRLLDGTIGYIQQGNVEVNPKLKTREELVSYAKHLANCDIPYFFGGRTPLWGYDCSGLTQEFASHLGVKLPRNASQQIHSKNCKEIKFDELKPCDLIFWGRTEKATHCGMYIGDDKFVHANVRELQGKISISTLSDPVWNPDKKDTVLIFRAFRRIIT